MSLPINNRDEAVMQISKSRKIPILIDLNEMENLFSFLGDFVIYNVSRPVSKEEMCISREHFLQTYEMYINGIKKGKLIDETPLKPFFSAVFTLDSDVLYAIELKNRKYLVRARRPVIQLQRHHFIYSDHFHSGVMGFESITWGIQFSYPQLFLDPSTKAIGKVDKSDAFPNTALFARFIKWVRDNTGATPFILDGKKSNQPMRLGINCFSWINAHPSLREKNLYVENRRNSSAAL